MITVVKLPRFTFLIKSIVEFYHALELFDIK